jgi:Tfp pilus assembly protein PilN/cellobiose-specific phosphotransferase system component IIB
MAKNTLLGIEFTAGIVRIAACSLGAPARGVKVLSWFESAGMSDEAIAARIKDAVAEARYERLIIFVPRRTAIVRFLELPSQDEKEIRTMVTLQIERHLPYSLDEINYDIAIAPSKKQGYSHVTLAALQKKDAARIQAILAAARISPDLLTLASSGTVAAFQGAPEVTAERTGVTVIVDADHDESELIFLADQTVITTRSIIHSPDFLKAHNRAEFSERLCAEIETTRDSAQSTYGFSRVDTILLGPALSSFLDDFKKRFAQSGIAVRTTDALNECAPHAVPIPAHHSLLSVLGLPFISPGSTVDFLPHEAKKDSRLRASSAARKVTIALIIALLSVIIGGTGSLFYSRYAYIRNLEKEIMRLDPEAKKISSTVKKITIIDEIKKGQIVPLEIIRELYAIVPEKMFLTILEYDFRSGITMRGFAAQLSEVSDFLMILQQSDVFKNAEIRFAKQKQIKGQDGVDFEIYCPYFTVRD